MRLLRGVLVLAFLSLGLPAQAVEEILEFDSNIVVGTDGVLTVTETIQVRAEGNQIRRGILRDFPTDYKTPDGRRFTTTFDVVKVTMNGGDVNWTTERLPNGTRVRIGSAEVFLKPGVYSYEIRYHTDRQLYFGEGYDELYWNVTGTGWDFPIEKVRASVLIPDGALVNETRGFTGYQGDTDQNFEVRHVNERRVVFETNSPLGPRQGLTIVVTWPEGFVARPTAADLTTHFFRDNLGLILAYLGFLGISAYFYLTWKRVGEDPDTGPVVARYRPPLGLSPAAVGYIKERDYSMAQFSAAIVNMAVKGFLKIEELGKRKFRLVKIGAMDKLSPGEKKIAAILLASQTSIETEQKNHSEFRRAWKAHEGVLEGTHENVHFIRNQKYFWIGAAMSLLVAVLAVGADAAFSGFQVLILPFLLLFYGIFFFAIRKGLRPGGNPAGRIKFFIIGGFLLVHFFGMAGGLLISNFFIVVPFILIIGVNILFFNLLEKPTIEGAQLLHEILGFKMYLSMAEKERLEFHTGEITPEKFEAFLPYAIALGVENKWGKAFEAEMVKAGMDPAQYQPVWYTGGNYYGFSGRSNFGSAFGAAFAGSVAAASSPPSSGGSGGGGFSGGGGGGGGGGGW